MSDYSKSLEDMCNRCTNHPICEGTGCQPKKDLADLIRKATPTRGVNRAKYRDDCPSCGHNIFPHMQYCDICGQALTWED